MLGGDPRPDGGRARRGRLDRRPQPPVAGPGRAQHRRRPARRDVRRPRAGRCSPSSTAGCWTSCSTGPAATRCGAASTTCPTPSTSGCCAAPPPSCASGCPGAAPSGGDRRAARRLDDATLLRRDPQPRRPRPRRAARRVRAIDDTRPTVIFAYTVKGYGLPTEGHPQNHSSLLTAEQWRELADAARRSTRRSPWARLRRRTARPARAVRARPAERLRRPTRQPAAGARRCPTDIGRTPGGHATTQAALGRALLDLTRDAPEAAKRVVTVSPDVSLDAPTSAAGSTRSACGRRASARDWFADDAETILHWREKPDRPAHRARHRRDQPGRADRRARRDLEPLGRAAAARSACSTTRSSSARWSRGRSASTRAASRSWSAPRPA